MKQLIVMFGALLFSTSVVAQDVPTVESNVPVVASNDSGRGYRIAAQLRLNLGTVLGQGAGTPAQLLPVATVGLRLGKLLVGVGVGFQGGTVCADDDCDNSGSTFTYSLAPVASFDVLDSEYAAAGATLAIPLGVETDGEACGAGRCTSDKDAGNLSIGVSLAGHVRGKINEALSIGAELGWGLRYTIQDGEGSTFAHGMFGSVVFEASI